MEEQSMHPRFAYADYERAIRAPYYEALHQISLETASLFQGCKRVLDIGSGQGMLLDALQKSGVAAAGVDDEPRLVGQCRERGLIVYEMDALRFLAATEERFDGIYCGHLIEHLPYEAMLDLIEGIRRVLVPDGLFVLRWPNPRSAITQHHVFWKDPTHSRFYDGSFVQAVLQFYNFQIVQTHYDTVAPQSGSALAGKPDEVLGAASIAKLFAASGRLSISQATHGPRQGHGIDAMDQSKSRSFSDGTAACRARTSDLRSAA